MNHQSSCIIINIPLDVEPISTEFLGRKNHGPQTSQTSQTARDECPSCLRAPGVSTAAWTSWSSSAFSTSFAFPKRPRGRGYPRDEERFLVHYSGVAKKDEDDEG